MTELLSPQFPSTRYQGSKVKLVDWVWARLAGLDFTTCLDAFGGTGAVAYRLKQAGKAVTYNDALRFNAYIGAALIENTGVRLAPGDIAWLLARHDDIDYPRFVQKTFRNIYFTDAENAWIDQIITNLYRLDGGRCRFALGFFALCQACIIKRPYNLFHRKNLYLRLAEVARSFGNKTTWDKPFDVLFRRFAAEANAAVFDNGQPNRALNCDVFDVPGAYDLVYIDPPYLSARGVGVDYYDFYHFLEGLTMYDEWGAHIDYQSKHRRLKRVASPWTDRARIHAAFDRLFARFQDSILVVSYRSDGIPSEAELVDLLGRYKSKVRTARYGRYTYALSTNKHSDEILLIGV
ncbi:MAG: DNA adenine methylase [Anaerolineae bacterium]|nr:DNA adenine methylase [Anaerolineae bacterium]